LAAQTTWGTGRIPSAPIRNGRLRRDVGRVGGAYSGTANPAQGPSRAL